MSEYVKDPTVPAGWRTISYETQIGVAPDAANLNPEAMDEGVEGGSDIEPDMEWVWRVVVWGSGILYNITSQALSGSARIGGASLLFLAVFNIYLMACSAWSAEYKITMLHMCPLFLLELNIVFGACVVVVVALAIRYLVC
jgi:hypothetical protein